jgi:hypothetical protein
MLDVNQFRTLIIKPALSDLNLFSEEASELLVFTCAAESNGGSFLYQVNGHALGIYQMEPETYNDIWVNYITHKQSLKLQLLHNFNAPVMPDEYRLVYDLRFATAMARIHYLRRPEPLPVLTDTLGLWAYYKAHYNTSKGSSTKEHAITAYNRFRNVKP